MSRKSNILFRVFAGILILLLLAVGASTFVVNYFKSKVVLPPTITDVQVIEVTTGDYQGSLSASGFVSTGEASKLFVLSPGRVERIYVQAGEQVTKGQVLIALDTSAEQANLSALQASLSATQLNVKGISELYKAGGASKLQLEQAQASLSQLQAQIEAARVGIANKTIRAPFTGTVGTINVAVGDMATAGTPILVMNASNKEVQLYIDLSVSPATLNEIEVGNSANIVDDAGNHLATGVVASKDTTINSSTGLSKIRVNLENSQNIHEGQFVKVRILKNIIPEQIVVPDIAVSYSIYGETLFKVVPLDEADRTKLAQNHPKFKALADKPEVLAQELSKVFKVQEVFVKSKERFDNVALISDGLKSGDILITQPAELTDGRYVNIVPGYGLGIPNTFKLPAIAQVKGSDTTAAPAEKTQAPVVDQDNKDQEQTEQEEVEQQAAPAENSEKK